VPVSPHPPAPSKPVGLAGGLLPFSGSTNPLGGRLSVSATLAITCEATSEGGTGSGTAIVNRDTTPPTVTCPSPAPVFQLYQLGTWVTATVTDATSGRATPPAQGAARTTAPGTFTTPVTGSDRAGNRTTVLCSYSVVVPTCRGLTPTRVGTALNDVINGTAGRDVIVICGGDGPDKVDGGAGNDVIDGEASPDDLNGGSGDDTIDGGLHLDSIRGDNGRDTCTSGEQRMSSCEVIV
jgi:Ca2+-binding RTX toxin-like protein